MIDNNLDEFLKKEKINATRLLEACTRIKDVDENSLYCLDYILACTEYHDFYNYDVFII